MFEDIYSRPLGRLAARVLAAPFVSFLAGAFMDSRLSRPFIRGFAKRNMIDMSEVLKTDFSSFNDFFTRELKPGARPLCPDADALIAPCDGLLSVYDIGPDSRFDIKGHLYTAFSLTENQDIARAFDGGKCLVFRLTPSHYHRYIWPVNGRVTGRKHIRGLYHTVRPGALEHTEVFKTNTREYALCETDFGRLLYMEVGAMLVGRIVNRAGQDAFSRGDEKGYFAFGGSTIVLLLEAGAAELEGRFSPDAETPVRAGEKIGIRRKDA